MMRAKVIHLKSINPDYDGQLLEEKAVGLSESAAVAADAESRDEVSQEEAQKNGHIQAERYRLRINQDAVAKHKKDQKRQIKKAKEKGEDIIIV